MHFIVLNSKDLQKTIHVAKIPSIDETTRLVDRAVFVEHSLG